MAAIRQKVTNRHRQCEKEVDAELAAEAAMADKQFSVVMETLESSMPMGAAGRSWARLGRNKADRVALVLICAHAAWLLVYGGLVLAGIRDCQAFSPARSNSSGLSLNLGGGSSSGGSVGEIARCADYKEQQFLACLVMLSAPFVVLLAVDWLKYENEVAMALFLTLAAFVAMRSVYLPVRGASGTDDMWGHLQLAPRRYYQRLAIANAVVANVLLLVYAALALKVKRGYGLFIHRIAKTDLRLREAYYHHSAFLTSLKMDMQFNLMLLATAFIFFFNGEQERWFVGAAAAVAVLTPLLGYYAVRHEKACPMGLFFLLSVLEPAVVVWQLVALLTDTARHSDVWKPAVVVTGSAATLFRTLVVFLGYRAWQNFGEGVPQALARVKNDAVQRQLQARALEAVGFRDSLA